MKRYFYLTPVLGGPGAPRYSVTSKPKLVGRSELADIALLEPTVSREHALIQCKDGVIYLEDLGSKHGTFVNSKRLIYTTKLKAGDIIVFGLSLVLRLEETDQPLPQASQLDHRPSVERTMSAVRPLPRDRLGSLTHPRQNNRDTDRVLDQIVKLRKLASAGALCAVALPEIYRQLALLGEAITQYGLEPAEVVDALQPLVDDLRTILQQLQLPTPVLEPTDLHAVVRQAVVAVTPLAAPRDVELLVGVSSELRVMADGSRLEAALIELLRNAISASPTGQLVEIVAGIEGRYGVLYINDHGEGIAEEVVARVFDPFATFRDDRIAVGLGLFEARQLVASLGGSLTIDSSRGKGTEVRIALRRA